MLVETKAKVGVFAIALGAYLPQFPTLVPEFEAQYDAFKKTIPDTVEMIDGGIVTTKELSMEAGDKFRAADVDLVILQLLTYATSKEAISNFTAGLAQGLAEKGSRVNAVALGPIWTPPMPGNKVETFGT